MKAACKCVYHDLQAALLLATCGLDDWNGFKLFELICQLLIGGV